jgi:superfamily II DNA or RNA helicase
MLDVRRLFTPYQKRQIAIVAGHKCQRCGEVLGGSWEAHHVIPYAKGGVTEVFNGMALCTGCHKRVHSAMTFVPREWQIKCHERERESRETGASKVFFLEACPGAGKSAMAAMIAKEWLQLGFVDHVVVIAPWRPVVASITEACSKMELTTSRSIFAGTSGYTAPPSWEVSVTTTSAGCSAKTVEALRQWSDRHGLNYAVIIDEIHHNSESGAWGQYADLLGEKAKRIVVMSGTPFRADGMPITFLQYHNDEPSCDYRLGYTDGVREGYVRDVTTRWIRGSATVVDRGNGKTVEKPYSELTKAEVSQIQDELFDSRGELVRSTVEAVHSDLMRIRQSHQYSDAAALFVCRPGSTSGESDKRVFQVAETIRRLTNIEPVVVTHKDQDAEGKIRMFRDSDRPYIVAVNMISEGCDIPRLLSVGLLRLISSPMLVRQIVGRVIRRRGTWDEIAANVYSPFLAPMAAELERLYEEGAAGIQLRTACESCGHVPCTCVKWCGNCGNYQCDCPKCDDCGRKKWQCVCEADDKRFALVDAEAEASGGRFVDTDIDDGYVEKAKEVAFQNSGFRSINTVHFGAFLQAAGMPLEQFSTSASPEQHRRRLIDKSERLIRRLARLRYSKNETMCVAMEVTPKFSVTSITEAKARLASDDCQRLVSHLMHQVERALQ